MLENRRSLSRPRYVVMEISAASFVALPGGTRKMKAMFVRQMPSRFCPICLVRDTTRAMIFGIGVYWLFDALRQLFHH